MADLVDVAIGEIGYKESGSNQTKYGEWYGLNGAPWCHMFVSWCGSQAGYPLDIVPKTASCEAAEQGAKRKKYWADRGSYTPQRNDIVYFRSGSHAGIVEYVENGRLHTIEGNSSDVVKRRDYDINDSKIDGYRLVHDRVGGTSGGGTPSPKTVASGGESSNLAYVKKMLKKVSENTAVEEDNNVYEIYPTSGSKKVQAVLTIQSGNTLFQPPILDGLSVTFQRRSTAGTLEFDTIQDKNFKIQEGNAVTLMINGTRFFYGFVFTNKRKKDGTQSVTAYDQLRYLKNKDTYIYKKKTVTSLIRMIAKDFGLNLGKLAKTKYLISRAEDNAELYTVINNALDETMANTGTIYVLYDEAGKLRLRKPWKVNDCLIDGDTAQEYNYTSSIDSDVYNKIKLAYENKEKGTLDVYIAQSTKSINRWGTLQYFEKLDNPSSAKLQAKILLKMYNRVARTLSISGVFGNTKVRAGCLIPVLLDLGDVKVANYMIVDKVTHKFNNYDHVMDLEISGGAFDGTSGN